MGIEGRRRERDVESERGIRERKKDSQDEWGMCRWKGMYLVIGNFGDGRALELFGRRRSGRGL